MWSMIRKLYHLFDERKRSSYISHLANKGLQLGRNVEIMDGCFLDPSHCFLISIGDGSTLAPNVRLIAHDASTKKHIGYTKIGRIRIGKNCFIGDSSLVLPGVSIGENSIIGSGSVVIKDIEPGSVAVGNPCKKICSIEDYMKQNLRILDKKKAPFAESGHDNLTREQQQEVLLFLDQGLGYIR